MASITLSGVLKDNIGNIIAGAKLKFTAIRTSTDTLNTLTSEILTDSSGNYSSALVFGVYQLSIKLANDSSYKVVASNIVVNNTNQSGTITNLIKNQQEILSINQELIDLFFQYKTDAANSANSASSSATLAQKWAANPVDTIVSGSSYSALHYATKASGSATAAKTSETNAKTSETNSKTSETNASSSATTATAKANVAATQASNAASSASNAASSATAAASSATAAASSASSASTSATTATTQATTATTKASEALASSTLAQKWAENAVDTTVTTGKYSALHWATKAANSATAAANSATAAATSETNAAASATSASGSATTATTKANEAAASASTANTKAIAADASATAAAASANTATTKASDASTSAGQAATSATTASTKAAAATTSETNAKTSETNAKTSETNSKTSETNAKTSETNAAASATSASASATTATTQASTATSKATAAATSATNAKTSETNAKTSETNAAASAIAAQEAADQAAAVSTGALVEAGSVDLSSGIYPTPLVDGNGAKLSCFWKVSVAGVVNSIDYNVNDSVVYSKTLNSYYKIDNTEAVTSVNGMQGAVTITKATISLGNVDNTSDANKPISTATQSALNLKAPSSHVGTGGTAHAQVTTTVDGFMIAADKVKLDGMSAGANNYIHPASPVTVGTYKSVTVDGNGHVTAGSNPTTLAGYGITDAAPASHIGSSGTSVHAVATTSVAGFMSATDKTKLDGIATSANNYTHPTSGVTAGTYKSVTVDANGHVTAGSNPTTLSGYGITDAAPSSHVGSTGSAHGNVTTTVAGFMSASDKSKLDGIAASANNYTHPASGVTAGTYKSVTVDANGHVTAGTNPTTLTDYGITDALGISANAVSASKWATPRTVTFTGGGTGSGSIDGSANVSIALTIPPTGHVHALSTISDSPYKEAADVATTAALTVTATTTTLTNAGTLAALVLDGVTCTAGMRVLVKDQAATAQNGIYTVTNIGSASVAWVLTRSADADTSAEIAGAVVTVDQGTANGAGFFTNDFKKTSTLGTTGMLWRAVIDAGNISSLHHTSGVTAGTYKSVTVNAQGHITAGTNPTTLAGYGITDAAPSGYGLGTSSVASRGNWTGLKQNGWYEYNADAGDSGGPASYGNILNIGQQGNASGWTGWAGQLFISTGNQVYTRVNSGAGVFSNTWAQLYSTAYKPSASDVGALPISGGTLNGNLNAARYAWGTSYLDNTGSTSPMSRWVDSTNHIGVFTLPTKSACFGSNYYFTGSAWAISNTSYGASRWEMTGGVANLTVRPAGGSSSDINAMSVNTTNGNVAFGGVLLNKNGNMLIGQSGTSGNDTVIGNKSGYPFIYAYDGQVRVEDQNSTQYFVFHEGNYPNRINIQGSSTIASGTNRVATGLYSTYVYNSGYPATYGNVLTLNGGGAGQLFIEWSGTSTSSAGYHGGVWVRNQRDSAGTLWSDWARFYTTAYKPSATDVGALPIGGGELSGHLSFAAFDTGWRGIYGTMGTNDGWTVRGMASATNAGYLEIATGDDGTEPIYVRQYTGQMPWGSGGSIARTLTLLDGSGNTNIPGTVTTADVNITSDRNLKREITPIRNALDKVRKIIGCTFYKTNDELEAGVIAQDVEEVFSPAVRTNEETGIKSVTQSGLIGLIFAALNELDSRIIELESKI